MLYNKEQLEDLIKSIKENIVMAETLIARRDPDSENVEVLERMLERHKDELEKYTDQLNNLNQVGRPPIGITRKVSLTLTEKDWAKIDEKADGNRSKFLREIISKALKN